MQRMLILLLILISQPAMAWQSLQPGAPAAPTPSVNQSAAVPPKDLMTVDGLDQTDSSSQLAAAWGFYITGQFNAADAETIVQKLRQQGYPTSTELSGNQVGIYVGPEIDKTALSSWRDKVQKMGYTTSDIVPFKIASSTNGVHS